MRPYGYGSMRRLLNFLYRASGVLGAFFLAAICLTVLAQVGARLIDRLALWLLGERIGLIVPSAAEFTGFFLVAAAFLGLAYTLRAGGHIRVSLLIRRLGGRRRRWFEAWCLGSGTLLCGYFAWHAILLVRDSLAFGEMSYGIIAVPLWIPQTGMALGLVVLTIALLDDWVVVLGGRDPSYREAEEKTEEGGEPWSR